jgi:hypothetical protein
MSNWPDWVLEEMARRPVDVGVPFGKIDLHHAILSKRAVMGMPEEERAKINVPWNLLKVQHDAHITRPVPEGREAAELLYRIYGRGAVLVWYASLNWKNGNPPFQLP